MPIRMTAHNPTLGAPYTPVPPRWQSQHELLCRVLQGDRDGSMAKTTGWSIRSSPRVALMEHYVMFLKEQGSPLFQQVQQILEEMTHRGNKRHRKPLREQAWNLCVGDASLRLPEFKA